MNRPDGCRVRGGGGQTVIETIFMLIILLTLFFFIAEFARGWYLKNSLNNAVRVGVRVAVVTSPLNDITSVCSGAISNAVVNAVCTSPGVPENTAVVLDITANDPPPGLLGDTVIINATAPYVPFLPFVNLVLPGTASSSASMRHE